MHVRVAVLLVVVAMSGCIEIFQQGFADDEGETAPAIGFADDEGSDQIVVMQTPAGVRWSDLNMSGDRPAYFRLNDGPSRQFSPTRQSPVGGETVSAGDKIDFCVPNGGRLEVRVLYTPENVIMHVFTFASLTEHKWCG